LLEELEKLLQGQQSQQEELLGAYRILIKDGNQEKRIDEMR